MAEDELEDDVIIMLELELIVVDELMLVLRISVGKNLFFGPF